MWTEEEVLDRLETMFAGDDSVETRRTQDSVTFSQYFTNDVHVDGALFEKQKRVFEHTVLVKDGTYKATDKISYGKLGPTHFDKGYMKGELFEKGFFYGLGIDNTTGETGLVRREWSTEYIKAPVREFMETTGLKRVRLFWTGKRIAIFFACVWIPIIIAAIVILLTVH